MFSLTPDKLGAAPIMADMRGITEMLDTPANTGLEPIYEKGPVSFSHPLICSTERKKTLSLPSRSRNDLTPLFYRPHFLSLSATP